jgi:hypothetical protein
MAVLVVKNGAILNPLVDYNVAASGGAIVFAVAPTGVDVVYLVYLGTTVTQSLSLTQNVNADSYTGDGSTTAFTLTAAPYSVDNLIVFIDGVAQAKTANYTVSGSTLTFTSAPDTGAAIVALQLLVKVNASWVSIDSTISAFNALSNGKYLVDSNSAGTVATLPAAPAVGDTEDFVNVSTAPYTLTLNPNGLKIDSSTSNVSLTAYGNKRSYVYSGPTKGWITVNS